MDLIEITTNDSLARYLDSGSEMFEDTASSEWPRFAESANEGYVPWLIGKCDVKDCSLQVNNKQYEFMEPVVTKQSIIYINSIRGNTKTLSAAFLTSFSDMNVVGRLRVIDDLNTIEMSEFELSLTNIKVEFLTGLYIEEDSFCIDNVISKLSNVSLGILKGKNEQDKTCVSLFDDIADNTRRKILEMYLAEHFLSVTIDDMKDRLSDLVNFPKTYVSYFVGIDYSQRDQFRLHKKRITEAFNQTIDHLLDLTNNHICNNKLSFLLPDIIIPSSDQQNKAFQLLGGSIKCSAQGTYLARREGTSIDLVKDGSVILFADINIGGLMIRYNKYIDNSGEVGNETESFDIPYKHHAYIKISVRKTSAYQADIQFMDFKIPVLSICLHDNIDEDQCSLCKSRTAHILPLDISPRVVSWINYALGVEAVPFFEDELQKIISMFVKDETLISTAIRPNNFEYIMDELCNSDEFDNFYSDTDVEDE